jgi:hypothetical protein
MTMNRRGFLGSILAIGAAPAIVRADSLMRIVAMDATLIVPEVGRLGEFNFYESDLTLTLDDYSRRFIQPAMLALRQDIERDILSASLTDRGQLRALMRAVR